LITALGAIYFENKQFFSYFEKLLGGMENVEKLRSLLL